MNYMRQFYYSGTEPLVAYMWWALRREFDLFSPVAIGHAGVWAEALGLGLVVVCLVTLFRLFRKEKELPAGAAAPVVFVVLTLSLLAASVAGKYPFGGHMRHQYIIFPFAVLSTFLLLDRVAERLKRRIPQLVLVFVAAALLIANAGQGWKTGDIHREELFTSEFHFFGKEYMPVGAVYVDQFNLIAFFSNVQDWTWHFDRNLIPGKIDLLRMEKEGRHLSVLRDLSRWKARTDDPRLYEDIDVAMTKAGLGAVAVFRLSPEDPGAAPQKTEQDRLSMKISRMAEEHGFVADHVMFHDGYVYVLFSRRHDRGDRLTDVNDSGRITWKECGTRAVCSLGISGRS